MPELEEEGSLNLDETLARLTRFLANRLWWILLPFCCVTLSVITALLLLPDRYTSTAKLLVVQQQVPQRYVVPNSTTDVTSALQAMKQEVLSRTQLLRMINEFGLYPKQRERLAPEDLLALMLRDIDLMPIIENPQREKDFDAFRISFTADNGLLAQQVTNTLTSLFINEYLRTGAEHATNTTNFLHQQVEEKGKELQAQEERLRDFKLSHVGQLPEQQQGNLGILAGLQTQLQNTMASLNRAQQQRALLQAQLQATPRRRFTSEAGGSNPITGSPTPASPPTPVQAAQNELARLEAIRSNLLSKGYTPQHPDMVRNQREITRAADLLKQLKAAAIQLEARHPPAQIAPNKPIPLEPTDDPAVAQIRANLEANRMEIENLTNEEKRLKASVAQYEARINETPIREQQQAGLLRDTEVLRQQYADLLKKEQESQLATNLEKQQGGQQFRLIDPASLPTLPSSPKRVKMSLGGAAAGLVLGLALAIFMEIRNTSFFTEKEVTKHLAPPFVLGIPVLSTPMEVRRRKLRNLIQFVTASVMLLVVIAAEAYVLKHG